MPLTLLLALQAAAATAPAPPPRLLDLDFDLARYNPAEFDPDGGCNRSDPSAIIVCARRSGGGYPLERMARIFEPRRLVAEIHLSGNLTGNVHLHSVPLAGGVVSNRVMVGLRLPF
jgi:hypothetical protein